MFQVRGHCHPSVLLFTATTKQNRVHPYASMNIRVSTGLSMAIKNYDTTWKLVLKNILKDRYDILKQTLITTSTFFKLLPVNGVVQRPLKERKCSGKLKSDLIKSGLFVALKWFHFLSLEGA